LLEYLQENATQERILMGNQFLTAADSVGANIDEGYGRFHYLDRVKFLYNGRASMLEAFEHWLQLLLEREFISDAAHDNIVKVNQELSINLNNFISSIYKSKQRENEQ
jgi:four helix bundle protein